MIPLSASLEVERCVGTTQLPSQRQEAMEQVLFITNGNTLTVALGSIFLEQLAVPILPIPPVQLVAIHDTDVISRVTASAVTLQHQVKSL